MTDQNPAPLETVFLWLGQPDDEPEHLLMILVDGEDEAVPVYRPLLAVSRDHADQLADLAQQAADGLNVPVVLREYLSTDSIAGRVEPLVRLEPRP
jgi:hypothetical protein